MATSAKNETFEFNGEVVGDLFEGKVATSRCRVFPERYANPMKVKGVKLAVRSIVFADNFSDRDDRKSEGRDHKVDFTIGALDRVNGGVLVVANPSSDSAFLDANVMDGDLSSRPGELTADHYIGISEDPDQQQAIAEAVGQALNAVLGCMKFKGDMTREQALAELTRLDE